MSKKKRVKLIAKKIIRLLLMTMLFLLVYSFSYSFYEHIHTNVLISNFKNRADDFPTYRETFYKDDIKIERHYYSVSRETSELDGRNVIHDDFSTKKSSNLPNIGYKGDIFVARQSPFPNIPIIHELLTMYTGGHAAIYDGDGYVYEAVGMPDSFAEIIEHITHDPDLEKPNPAIGIGKQSYRYWFNAGSTHKEYYNLYYKTNFQVLRAKNNQLPVSDDFLDEVVSYTNSLYEDKRNTYNYLFMFNMLNKYYCTDLISRAYDYVYSGTDQNFYAKSMNQDGFITSVNDLILSRDTYIALHFEVERLNGGHFIEKYYFLEQIS